jgi:hypothetical protein
MTPRGGVTPLIGTVVFAVTTRSSEAASMNLADLDVLQFRDPPYSVTGPELWRDRSSTSATKMVRLAAAAGRTGDGSRVGSVNTGDRDRTGDQDRGR